MPKKRRYRWTFHWPDHRSEPRRTRVKRVYFGLRAFRLERRLNRGVRRARCSSPLGAYRLARELHRERESDLAGLLKHRKMACTRNSLSAAGRHWRSRTRKTRRVRIDQRARYRTLDDDLAAERR